jgi:hypothetical protein
MDHQQPMYGAQPGYEQQPMDAGMPPSQDAYGLPPQEGGEVQVIEQPAAVAALPPAQGYEEQAPVQYEDPMAEGQDPMAETMVPISGSTEPSTEEPGIVPQEDPFQI